MPTNSPAEARLNAQKKSASQERMLTSVASSFGRPPGASIALAGCSQPLPPTDVEGRVQRDLEVGAFTILVLPKRLQNPQAQQELYRNRVGDDDPRTPLWIRLADVQIAGGESREIELRLPADW